MSGFETFFRISLYNTQPENSDVIELIRKSRNSWRSASGSCAASAANSGVRWKWSMLLSPSYSFSIASHSARTAPTSSRSIAA